MSWYRTGTVNATNGSTTVTGSGTSWIVGVGIGEAFYGPDGRIYEIANIISATQLTLGSVYLGSTVTGQTYQIVPTTSYIRDLAAQAANLVSNYAGFASTAGTGQFGDGTLAEPGVRFSSDVNTGLRRAGTDDMRLVAAGADQVQVTAAGLLVQDAKLRITGSADATKVAVFEVDGLTTATTRTYTLPNTSTTVVGTHNKITDLAAVTSAELLAKVSDETGTGALVFGTSPTLNTPVLNAATLNTPTLTTPNLTNELVSVTTNNLPALRPSLNLDFSNSRTLDPRITFTRASTATRINSLGLVEAVASGAPRFDFDPVTLACKGLLIEEARTNLLTYSEQFDNAAWGKVRAAITANATTAPDGTLTADKLVEDTSSSTSHYIAQAGAAMVSGLTYTYSFYAKAAERSFVYYQADPALFGGARATFNLLTGESLVNSGAGSAQATFVGNGWYRCSFSIVATASGTLAANLLGIVLNINASASYTGDGTSGLFIWGAQLEAGAFPTSYIPTVAAAVTRAAEVATMTGVNFSSWYRADEGAFAVAFSAYAPLALGFNRVFEVNDGTFTNNIAFLQQNGSGAFYTAVGLSGVEQASLATALVPPNTYRRNAIAYAVNSFAQSFNGATAVTDSAGAVPIVNRLVVGGTNGSGYLNGHIANLSYYPKRVSNAELQALSTP